MNILTEKDSLRFWGKVDKEKSTTFYNGSRCWEWVAARFPNGYGKIGKNNKVLYAHRFSYEMNVGEIPAGYFVLHHCDNPPCVNPEHLFAGTQKDNMVDKVNKGRQPFGEDNPMTKLTNEQVDDIRRRYGAGGIGGESTHALGKVFGVSFQHIANIVARKRRK